MLITNLYTTPPLGPVEEDKIPVAVRRLQEARVDRYIIFYQAFVAGRSTVSPRANIGAFPSLVFNACLDALLSLKNEGVECFFADGEVDPCCAGLAARYNGYVLALDSDYMIFNASYKGYIPLDDLVWVLPDNTGFSNHSDGFQTASHTEKKIGTHAVRSLIPPPNFSSLTVFTHRPEMFAASLRISTHLLPLLASVLENDFISPTLTSFLCIWLFKNESTERLLRYAPLLIPPTNLSGAQDPKRTCNLERLMALTKQLN